MRKTTEAIAESLSGRQESLLGAAAQVFARYGYRKTSLDQVARAAGWSRQGLYVHFASKEALFQATVEHALSTHLHAVVDALSQTDQPLNARLLTACDEWAGRYIGVGDPEASDLIGAGASIAGDTIRSYNVRFEDALAEALSESAAMKAYAASKLTASSIAVTLHIAVQGLKDRSETRQRFRSGLKTIIAVLLAH